MAEESDKKNSQKGRPVKKAELKPVKKPIPKPKRKPKKPKRGINYNLSSTLVITFLTLFLVFVLFGNYNSMKHANSNPRPTKKTKVVKSKISNPREKQVKTYKKLMKQKYITTQQFNKLYQSAQKEGNTGLIEKFDNTKLVDNDDGHVYMVEIIPYNQGLDLRYHLTAINNGKSAEINPDWAKEHNK